MIVESTVTVESLIKVESEEVKVESVLSFPESGGKIKWLVVIAERSGLSILFTCPDSRPFMV